MPLSNGGTGMKVNREDRLSGDLGLAVAVADTSFFLTAFMTQCQCDVFHMAVPCIPCAGGEETFKSVLGQPRDDEFSTF